MDNYGDRCVLSPANEADNGNTAGSDTGSDSGSDTGSDTTGSDTGSDNTGTDSTGSDTTSSDKCPSFVTGSSLKCHSEHGQDPKVAKFVYGNAGLISGATEANSDFVGSLTKFFADNRDSEHYVVYMKVDGGRDRSDAGENGE
jgi:hypothetical protein